MASTYQQTIERAALLMGYRRTTSGKFWAKPLGYSCLTIDPKKGRLEQWFWGVNGDLTLWNSQEFKQGDVLEKIKEFEVWGIRTDLPRPQEYLFKKHHFEFASLEEDVALALK
jgi:hypothetical protein